MYISTPFCNMTRRLKSTYDGGKRTTRSTLQGTDEMLYKRTHPHDKRSFELQTPQAHMPIKKWRLQAAKASWQQTMFAGQSLLQTYTMNKHTNNVQLVKDMSSSRRRANDELFNTSVLKNDDPKSDAPFTIYKYKQTK